MKRQNSSSKQLKKLIGKACVFERALHQFDSWLDSIALGRKSLSTYKPFPPLNVMREIAEKSLAELSFTHCTIFEIYWLSCVFSNYETKEGFNFSKIILPDWFPFPHGFKHCDWLDLRKKRIYPPETWTDAKVQFMRERNTRVHYLRESDIKPYLERMVPDTDFTIVLSPNHPIRQLFKRGRPVNTFNGETILPHKSIDSITVGLDMAEYQQIITPKTCIHCGGSMLWDKEENDFKCLACSRYYRGN